jgi:S-adenosylmethionine-diacylglycerol 3-amino-3-carboxypropyl transferase
MDRWAIFDSLKRHMPAYARDFWKGHMNLFDPGGLRSSFYYRTAAGSIAWIITRLLFRGRQGREARDAVTRLLDGTDLDEQAATWAQVEQLLLTPGTNWLLEQPSCMAMLGVPRSQIRLMEKQGGIAPYIRKRLEKTLGQLPGVDNYFWRVYANGSYSKGCCPNYLNERNFETLRNRVQRIKPVTCSLSAFLREHPGSYSHYVLLDHQDWLAELRPAALQEEWELILANSQPGTQVLMRSASEIVDFIPQSVRSRMVTFPQTTTRLHALDRVGTYGSLHHFVLV